MYATNRTRCRIGTSAYGHLNTAPPNGTDTANATATTTTAAAAAATCNAATAADDAAIAADADAVRWRGSMQDLL